MPNRIIKESICTSENIDVLSADAENFFYRLMVNCDDYGRFDGRPAVLRSSCFPLRVDTINDDAVMALLEELVSSGLVLCYKSDGRAYIQITKWDKHQQIRAKRSKYPEMIADDSNGNQLQSNVPVIQSNPIQYEEARKPAPPPHPKSQTPPAVATFREKAKAFPIKAQWPAIEQAIGDAPAALELWGRVVSGYILCGWNPRNVSGMIEFYKRGEVPSGNGKHKPQDQTAPPVKVVTAADIPSIEVSPEQHAKARAMLEKRLGKK